MLSQDQIAPYLANPIISKILIHQMRIHSMGKKTICNLSKSECSQIHETFQKNSYEHFITAELCAEKGKFGIGVALLILCIEEGIKGIVVFLDGEGLTIRKIKGVKKLFKDHIIRHELAGLLALCNRIISAEILDIELLNQAIKSGSADDFSSEFNEKIESMKEELTNEMEWWQSLDKLKQNGFYVDFEDELIFPSQIKKEKFIEVNKNAFMILKSLKSIKDFFEKLNEKTEEDRLIILKSIDLIIRNVIKNKQ